MKVIEINNISKRFSDKLVLDNISFQVDKGEIFGLLGPNGAGKSTLINIIVNILIPDSGKIVICGNDVVKDSIESKKHIGYVPQDIALMENLNAYDNLEFFGVLYGLKGTLLKHRINEVLDIVGLRDKKKEKVKKFSGGMKRRLNIAAAIMHHPEVLILDEPTVGVDPQSRQHIFNFIKKIGKEWGTTVLYTSHYMEEVEELCERVMIMDLGVEIAYGNKEDIKYSVFPNNKVVIDTNGIKGQTILSIREINGVIKVTENEKSISLTVNDKFKLGECLRIFEEEDISVNKISYEEAKLEDVFLTLTGKNLRD
ncbi:MULTISPECIES: ABC transporter ATP-binding protein [Clostridium]|uniref:ABC transporter ATP-binding protein n=1 Tax=Clostridium cibarium TaxID=2762247 RepID=A0ABR8PQS5_9CLOT|nr:MULTISPECIES: ABC transporter ATP-binding protein [Clostridium]MBD7910526.1 ABC transporter ATP-binding protein [Clostridium cibarium]